MVVSQLSEDKNKHFHLSFCTLPPFADGWTFPKIRFSCFDFSSTFPHKQARMILLLFVPLGFCSEFAKSWKMFKINLLSYIHVDIFSLGSGSSQGGARLASPRLKACVTWAVHKKSHAFAVLFAKLKKWVAGWSFQDFLSYYSLVCFLDLISSKYCANLFLPTPRVSHLLLPFP